MKRATDWRVLRGTGLLICLVLVMLALMGGCSDSRRAHDQERQLAELAARVATLAQNSVSANDASLKRLAETEASVRDLGQTTKGVAAQLSELAGRVAQLEGRPSAASQRAPGTESGDEEEESSEEEAALYDALESLWGYSMLGSGSPSDEYGDEEEATSQEEAPSEESQRVRDLEVKVTNLNGQITKLTQDKQKVDADLKTAQATLKKAQDDLKKAQDSAAALAKADPVKFVGTWVMTKADGTRQNMVIAKNADNTLVVIYQAVGVDGSRSEVGRAVGLALPADRLLLVKDGEVVVCLLANATITESEMFAAGRYQSLVGKGDSYKK